MTKNSKFLMFINIFYSDSKYFCILALPTKQRGQKYMKKKFILIMMVAAMAASALLWIRWGSSSGTQKERSNTSTSDVLQTRTNATCVVQPSTIKQLNRRLDTTALQLQQGYLLPRFPVLIRELNYRGEKW